MPKVIFVVDCKQTTGLGHLMRCIATTDALLALSKKQKMSIRFFLNGSSLPYAAKRIDVEIEVLTDRDEQKKAAEIAAAASNGCSDLIIVDSYLLTAEFYKFLRSTIPTVPVLALDDFGEKVNMPVAGLINFGLSADRSLYPPEMLKHSAIGPEYFPLRKEFMKEKPCLSQKRMKSVKRILITMGGSDPENQTVRIVKLLKKIPRLDIIDVLLGPAYGSPKKIQQVVRGDNRFILHYATSNIVPLMKQADLAITGGGTTCQEMVFLGVPIAVLILAKSQKPTAKAVEHYGCGHSLGYFASLSDAQLENKITKLINHPELLAKMVARGKGIIDGKGGNRIAEFIRRFIEEYHNDRYSVSEVKKEYETAASEPEEYKKVKWGSRQGMFNRFYLGLKLINWKKVSSWLDVGSGTGAFLKEAEEITRLKLFRGVDISPSLVKIAREQKYKTKNVSFYCQNILEGIPEGPFDLVTCIGVLQKCGIPLKKMVARLSEITAPGGQIFLTTKNRDWKKFQQPGFLPCPDHHWFHLSDIKQAFSSACLKIIKLEGFEPRSKGQTCPPEESHSIYILARKVSGL